MIDHIDAVASRGQALRLPSSLLSKKISLTQQTEEDIAFLRRLYLLVRREEMAATGWNEAQITVFLEGQFTAQYRHYALHYADAFYSIIRHGDEPIGRLALFSNNGDIRIVDIALLPEWRSRGIGTDLIQAIFAQARETSQTVSIHVEQFNPAQTLYNRLGFRKCGENGPYWLMEWRQENG